MRLVVAMQYEKGEIKLESIIEKDDLPEEIQSLADGMIDEILKQIGLIEVGRNDT